MLFLLRCTITHKMSQSNKNINLSCRGVLQGGSNHFELEFLDKTGEITHARVKDKRVILEVDFCGVDEHLAKLTAVDNCAMVV